MADQFSGGIETLKPLQEATDSHEAVGIWWARAVLSAHFELPGRNSSNLNDELRAIDHEARMRDAMVFARPLLEEHIGGLAQAVAHLSRERNSSTIRVDYGADPLLIEAANTCSLDWPRNVNIFPYKSATDNFGDRAVARLGDSGKVIQIWPPVE
jgi:hypothetical protein